MNFGQEKPEQELLDEIRAATQDVVETSAHVRRRVREARLALDELRHVEAPGLADAENAAVSCAAAHRT